jgi:hypothetical protein
MGWKKYLKLDEATITYGYPETGTKAIAGDDDFSTGNIIMGDKYKSVEYYNRLTSFGVNWVPETKPWKWDEFDATVSQSSKRSYHDTLKKDGPIDPERLFKHMGDYKPKPVPKRARLLGNDIGPFDDAWGDKDKFIKTADTDDVEGPEHSDNVEGPEMKNKKNENIINKIDSFL